MPNCTAIVPRLPDAPPIRVLEVDGPSYPKRTRPVERGEGCYYLSTSNHPPVDELRDRNLCWEAFRDRDRYKDWDEPCWDIYLYLNGRMEVTASRPTTEECIEGDLHGELGSMIHLRPRPGRRDLRNALRLARMLCKCDPITGIDVFMDELVGIALIESNIPVRCLTPSR